MSKSVKVFCCPNCGSNKMSSHSREVKGVRVLTGSCAGTDRNYLMHCDFNWKREDDYKVFRVVTTTEKTYDSKEEFEKAEGYIG